MNKNDLKKIALMGLAAGLTVANSASAEGVNPARNRTQNQASSQRLQGWRPFLDSSIPGYTKNRELAERHENDNNNNHHNGNGNGNGKNGNGKKSMCSAKGGCPGA